MNPEIINFIIFTTLAILNFYFALENIKHENLFLGAVSIVTGVYCILISGGLV